MEGQPPIRDILRTYGIAGLPVRSIRQGADNLTLAVGGPQPSYILRCYRVTRPDEIAFELDLVDYLVSSEFPTPRLIRTSDGDRIVATEGLSAVLFEYVAGTPISPGLKGAVRAARLAARLHGLTLGRTFDGHRSRSDLGRIRALLSALDDDPNLANKAGAERLHKELSSLREILDGWQDNGPPTGAIHHDLNPGNVLVDDTGEIVALIDFDEAYVGPLVFDIASLVHYWAPAGAGIDPTTTRRIVTAYEEGRPLTTDERAALPTAVRAFFAADAAEFILRSYRHRPTEFELAECRSLATYYALTTRDDWHAAFGQPAT